MCNKLTKQEKEVSVPVRLTEEMLEHLKYYSKKDDRTVTGYIRQLIRNDMKDKIHEEKLNCICRTLEKGNSAHKVVESVFESMCLRKGVYNEIKK